MAITYRGTGGRERNTTVHRCPEGESPKRLEPRTDLAELSKRGFGWGKRSNETNQLALALLADHTTDQVALILYKEFADEALRWWKGDSFEVTESELWRWMDTKGFNFRRVLLTEQIETLLSTVDELTDQLTVDDGHPELLPVRDELNKVDYCIRIALDVAYSRDIELPEFHRP